MAMDARIDLLAQQAARLVHAGKVESVDEAIHHAIEDTGWVEVPRPSRSLVRRHVQGLTMQAIGAAKYQMRIVDVWEVAVRVMAVLDDCDPHLLGRAACGHIDGGVTLYLRVCTSRRIGALAQRLVEAGFEEPRFSTADSRRFGRFDRIDFKEDGFPIVITRCGSHHRQLAEVDLFTGRPIESIGLDALRRQIETSQGEWEL